MIPLNVKLFVDGKEIPLKKFVEKVLNGSLVGTITTLKGVEKDWKEIEIRIKK